MFGFIIQWMNIALPNYSSIIFWHFIALHSQDPYDFLMTLCVVLLIYVLPWRLPVAMEVLCVCVCHLISFLAAMSSQNVEIIEH